MPPAIIKTYRQSIPATRFIGRKYGDEDRVDGYFGAKWNEWFNNGWFDTIEKQIDYKINDIYEDGDAYIGLMRAKDGEPFEYWIGMFMPKNTPVPPGFEALEFDESELGVCWIYGKEYEIYSHESICSQRLMEEGFKIAADKNGAYWFFERYCCPRFTTPDEQGNVILDICFYVSPQ